MHTNTQCTEHLFLKLLFKQHFHMVVFIFFSHLISVNPIYFNAHNNNNKQSSFQLLNEGAVEPCQATKENTLLKNLYTCLYESNKKS